MKDIVTVREMTLNNKLSEGLLADYKNPENSAAQGFQANKREGLFVKGPIPMSWLSLAAKLPGKSIHVALALFWLAGMKPQGKVKMTRQAQNLFNVSDDAYRDALPRLEEVGLIKVWRAPGQRAQVEIVHHIAQAPKATQIPPLMATSNSPT